MIHRCDQAVMILEAERGLPSRGRGWPCTDDDMLEICAKIKPRVAARMLTPWRPVETEHEWLDEYWRMKEVTR